MTGWIFNQQEEPCNVCKVFIEGNNSIMGLLPSGETIVLGVYDRQQRDRIYHNIKQWIVRNEIEPFYMKSRGRHNQ